MRPVFGGHRAVESDEACSIVKVCQQRGDVAVAHEDFRVRSYFFQIKFFEKVICAIAASSTDDRPNVVPLEHLFQLARSAIDGPRKIQILFQNRVEVERNISRATQGLAARVQVSPLNVASGRDDAYGITGAKGGRFDELEIAGSHGSRTSPTSEGADQK